MGLFLRFFIMIFSLSLFLIPGLPVRADFSLGANPIRVEQTAQPGERLTDAITFNNTGDRPIHIVVSIEDWDLLMDGTPVFQKAGSLPGSIAPWIRVNPSEFDLEPGERIDVRYTVAVPKEASPGGFRGAVVFSNEPRPILGQRPAQITAKGRIATLVYLTVGRPTSTAKITGLSATPGKGKKMEIALDLYNDGPVHFRTKGEVRIRDENGRTLGKVPLPNVPVLPDHRRLIVLEWDRGDINGAYLLEAVLDLGRPELIAAEAKIRPAKKR